MGTGGAQCSGPRIPPAGRRSSEARGAAGRHAPAGLHGQEPATTRVCQVLAHQARQRRPAPGGSSSEEHADARSLPGGLLRLFQEVPDPAGRAPLPPMVRSGPCHRTRDLEPNSVRGAGRPSAARPQEQRCLAQVPPEQRSSRATSSCATPRRTRCSYTRNSARTSWRRGTHAEPGTTSTSGPGPSSRRQRRTTSRSKPLLRALPELRVLPPARLQLLQQAELRLLLSTKRIPRSRTMRSPRRRLHYYLSHSQSQTVLWVRTGLTVRTG